MTNRVDVVVVGSLHFDVLVAAPYLPRTGETLIGDSWWWKPGGKGGNQAMAAARHGARTEMVGCLGDDLFGLRLRERLRRAGVGLGAVSTVVVGSGMSVAIQESGGDYAAVVVSGANRELQPAHVEAAEDRIAEARVLILQHEVDPATNHVAASLARTRGTTVVLNAAPARPIGDMGGLVDVLVCNAVEAEQLGASSVTDLASAQAAAYALGSIAPIVVVTAGAAGTAVARGDTAWTVGAHRVDSPETHGAGDVFTGAVAARLALDDPIEAAVRYANAAAALHVGSPEGERDQLGPDAVQGLLSEASGR